MAVLCPLSLTPVVVNGNVVVGAKVYFFDAGTTTPRVVFQNPELTAQHPLAVLTNASGRVPVIYIAGVTAYKIRIFTPGGILIEEIDGISADATPGGGGGGGGGSDNLETGDFVDSHRTGTRVGFVRANGRTIGSPTSGATERANADCEPLFLHLWNFDVSLPVSGGRGASAAADWAANKTIGLPDTRFRIAVPADDMGASAASRTAGADFDAGNGTTLGAVGGNASETLTTAMLPAHTHTASSSTVAAHAHGGSTAGAGGHAHSASSSAAGSHNHGGNTGNDGAHSHTYFRGDGAAVELGTGVSGSSGLNVLVSDATSSVGNHNHNISTDGSHSHSITVNAIGDHAHGFTTSADGSHNHGITVNNTGAGTSHNNMPPFIVITRYIKL